MSLYGPAQLLRSSGHASTRSGQATLNKKLVSYIFSCIFQKSTSKTNIGNFRRYVHCTPVVLQTGTFTLYSNKQVYTELDKNSENNSSRNLPAAICCWWSWKWHLKEKNFCKNTWLNLKMNGQSQNQRAKSIKKGFTNLTTMSLLLAVFDNSWKVSRVRYTVEDKQNRGLDLRGWKRPRLGNLFILKTVILQSFAYDWTKTGHGQTKWCKFRLDSETVIIACLVAGRKLLKFSNNSS